ncbi:hypothetical protein F4680DRAFT_74332 [Xylaria scruposa]|nr:hypothetical protein F4680DRAFT_74332 [Xylaria scruposa]
MAIRCTHTEGGTLHALSTAANFCSLPLRRYRDGIFFPHRESHGSRLNQYPHGFAVRPVPARFNRLGSWQPSPTRISVIERDGFRVATINRSRLHSFVRGNGRGPLPEQVGSLGRSKCNLGIKYLLSNSIYRFYSTLLCAIAMRKTRISHASLLSCVSYICMQCRVYRLGARGNGTAPFRGRRWMDASSGTASIMVSPQFIRPPRDYRYGFLMSRS